VATWRNVPTNITAPTSAPFAGCVASSPAKEMQKWCEKWDAMHDRYVKEREELQASKPAEVRNGSHSI
jgi:hypothetical protein